MNKFLSAREIWPRITQLAMKTKKSLVAVAYFGQGASQILPLRKGSVLVVDASQNTVKASGTCPKDILDVLARKVEVHNCSNLHAKVFVFGRRAIIGSTNVSNNSKDVYLEAAVETTDPNVVAASREFVLSLRGDQIQKAYAKELMKLWNPPKRDGIRRPDIPRFHPLWVVPLERDGWDEIDKKHNIKAEPVAKRKIKNKKNYQLEMFQWEGGALLAGAKKGHQIIQAIMEGTSNRYYPPSRIIYWKKYQKDGKPNAIYYLETPKIRPFKRTEETVHQALGKLKSKLVLKSAAQRIKSPVIARILYQLWPGRLFE